MRKALLIGAWMMAAISLFLLLVYAGEYSKQECIKNGGNYVIGTWAKECKHK